MSFLAARGVDVPGRLRGFDLDLARGELVALVGPSGAGKSTALGVLSGAIRSTVTIEGVPLATLGPRERAARIGWLPQRPLVPHGLTAREIVAAARYRFGERRTVALSRAEAALDQVGIRPFAERPLETLSGGEAQRVYLATLLAQDAEIWLVDEPGAHLDPARKRELVQVLREVATSRTVVWVTHDLELLVHLPPHTRVVGLADGRVAWEAPVDDPELPARLGALFALDLRPIEVDGVVRWVVR